MSTMPIQLFIHSQGRKPTKVEGEVTESLRDVLSRAGIIPAAELVFVGECVDALNESTITDDGEDSQEEVNIDLSLEELGVRPHHHIHCHACRRVAVEVHFGSDLKRRRFSPAATVEVATRWARKVLHLDDAAAADLVLQKCASNQRPRQNQHLGDLVSPGDCALCFDLVKEVTPQG